MHRITPKVVALIVAGVAFATAAFAQPASDHLACYGVKDPVRRGPSTLTLMNASVTQSCRIGSRAQLVCLETATSNVVPTPRGGGPTPGNVGQFLCYKLFCPKPLPPAAEMTDEFGGTRVIRFRAAQFLCAPATRSTGTTGSTTTSDALAPSPYDFNSDQRLRGHLHRQQRALLGDHLGRRLRDAARPRVVTRSSRECSGFCGASEPARST
jgi:hypothetical protein